MKKPDKKEELVLFTKPNCQKCQYVKEQCNLDGIKVLELKPNMGSIEEQIKSAATLGLLAYHESVQIAEDELPILGTPGGDKITGAINIKNYLQGRSKYEKNI